MTTLERAIELRNEKPEEALTILYGLLRKSPNDPILHYQCAITCDGADKEAEAAPHYEAALQNGLIGEDRRSAFLGLGSTYRCLGQYEKSLVVLDRAVAEFPEDRALKVFRSLTLYNLGNHAEALGSLLTQLVETTVDNEIKSYGRALLFYSDKLDETWT